MSTSNWQEYKREDCPICGSRGWCCHDEDDRGLLVMCMRPAAATHPGFLFSKLNGDGATAYFVRPDGDDGWHKPSSNGNGNGNGFHADVEPADRSTRHKAYETFLGVLNLSHAHNAALLRRGLSGPEIAAGRYRTLPASKRRDVAEEVRKRSGLDTETLLKVPGFARDDQGKLEVIGRAGLVVPVMGIDGTIGCCQLRPDDPGDGGKYVWLTSVYRHGPKAVTSGHIPPSAADKPHDLARLTEGPLKANVATSKDGLLTVAIPGCSQWRKALRALEALKAKTVRLAFDADIATNQQVCGALCNAARGLVAAGYEIEVERWDPALGKGIDDVLVAGGSTEVLAGLEAVRFVLMAAKHLKIDPAPVERGQVIPWIGWYLSRGLAQELSQDTELMKATARLEKGAPNKWTEVTALLKKHAKLIKPAEWLKACRKLARPPRRDGLPYVENDGRVCVIEYDDEGKALERPLANFTARITREIERDEIGGGRLQFEIEARHPGGHSAAAVVDAERYARMEWPESLGSLFTVASGRGVRDQLREAVQLLSHHQAEVPRIKVFTSLGWHDHGGVAIYCHAGGVIGPGDVEGVEVAISPQLSAYCLPAPTEDKAALQSCFDAHLEIGRIGSPGTRGAMAARAILVTLPWRAVLKPFNTTCHLGGPSGNFKTSLGQIAVQHFSAEIKGRICAPPESWRSTDNAIIGVLHQAKDCLLMVDDLKEDKDAEKAERVLQSIGDGKGRSRMGRDQALKESLGPRGSVLSTGEIDPRTPSTLGRVLAAEILGGDIHPGVLTTLQAAGDAGQYALLMSSYIRHVAGCRGAILDQHARWTVEYREKIGPIDGAHPRHVEAIADLIAAYRLFLRWATDKGLIDAASAGDVLGCVKDDLVALGKLQAPHQAEAKPGRKFLDLVISALSSGRCHLDNLDSSGEPRSFPEACGWRWEQPAKPTDAGRYRVPSGSRRAGWISEDDDRVYLDPVECKLVASEMLKVERNPQSFANIGRELLQEKLVEAGKEGRPDQKKKIRGAQTRCYCIGINHMFPQ
jgi:Domain of unknown function (DUF3854)/Domain of unknown function (DUF927)